MFQAEITCQLSAVSRQFLILRGGTVSSCVIFRTFSQLCLKEHGFSVFVRTQFELAWWNDLRKIQPRRGDITLARAYRGARHSQLAPDNRLLP